MAKKYQALFDTLRTRIQQGEYPHNEKLPSESEMMDTFGVSRQTIRHALDMLEEMGLIRKAQGSGSFVHYPPASLGTKRIAVLFFDLDISVFPAVMQQLDSSLDQRGYSVAFYTIGGSMAKERKVLQQLLDNPVDGIIFHAGSLSPVSFNLDLIQALREKGTKILFFDSWYANQELADLPSVCMENYDGPFRITEHLLQQGHKRIGSFRITLALGHTSRFSGICNALLKHFGEVNMADFFEIADLNFLDVIASKDFAERVSRLDAFICPSGHLFEPLVNALRCYGSGKLRTIVVFDEVTVPALPGVEVIVLRYPSREIAQLCVENLLDMIGGKAVTTTLVPWRLSEASTAKVLPAAFLPAGK